MNSPHRVIALTSRKKKGPVRSGPAPLVLERRLMFDGAAAADLASQAAVDGAVADKSAAAQAGDATATAHDGGSALLNLGIATSDPSYTKLSDAEKQAAVVLANFAASDTYAQTMRSIYGQAGTDAAAFEAQMNALRDRLVAGDLGIPVELLSGSQMSTMQAAYAAVGASGGEVIYVNADWIHSGVDSGAVQRVLLEEIGHAIDQRLNPGADSPGDEGEAFSYAVQNIGIDAFPSVNQDDHHLLTIDNKSVSVEAATPTIVQTYIVPLAEKDIQTALAKISSDTGTTIHTVISFTVTQVGTTIVYDNWEDGYETDLANPTQSTTRVWTNQAAGTVITLENDIPISSVGSLTANGGKPFYDGGDLIGASAPISVTRAGYATTPGTVLAGAVMPSAVENLGTSYTAPIGENITSDPLFNYSSLDITATADNTKVNIDKDGNGTTDVTVTLNKGQSYLVNGGVNAGATVTSQDALGGSTSKPIEVSMITGRLNSTYEGRWFALAPTSQWGSSYYSAVATTNSAAPSYVWLYNPDSAAITVTYDTQTTTGQTVSVAAKSAAFVAMPTGGTSGAHFYTSNGKVFSAVGTVDSDAPSSSAWDWSYGLTPESYMTDKLVAGWAPGNGNTPNSSGVISGNNGSPIWVTATADTTLYIDYAGNGWSAAQGDTTVSLKALQSYRIYDSTDNNQSGLTVYTTDGTLLAGAWGEDPLAAGAGAPFLDMGTVLSPYPDYVLKKQSAEAATTFGTNGDGKIQLGEQVLYTITVTNRSVVDLFGFNLKDSLSPTAAASYVASSATLTVYDSSGNVVYTISDLDGSANTFPLAGSGYTLTDADPNTAGNQGLHKDYKVIVTYRELVTSNVLDVSGANYKITNTVTLSGSQPDGTGVSQSVTNITPITVTAATDGLVAFYDSSYASTVSTYAENGTIYVQVNDGDQNRNTAVAETLTGITVTDTTTGETEALTLTETGVNTGIFRGSLATSTSSSDNGNSSGKLYMVGADAIKVEYTDPLFGTSYDNPTNPGIPANSGGISTGNANTANATVSLSTLNKILYFDATGSLDRLDPAGGSDTTTTAITGAAVTPASSVSISDSFDTVSYSGGSGWSGSWTETNDNLNGATNGSITAGAIQVTSTADKTASTSKGLQFGNSQILNTGTNTPPMVQRDFAAATTIDASITFDYKNLGLGVTSGTADTLKVEGWNGSAWYTIGTISGKNNENAASDSGFTSFPTASGSVTVTGNNTVLAGTSKIRYTYTANNPNSDNIYVDNISISASNDAATATYTQAIAMATDFSMPSAGQYQVISYISSASGLGASGSKSITADLTYTDSGNVSRTIGSLTSATYDSTNNTLTWTGALASNITVTAGSKFKLVITNNVASSSFKINYDNSASPSRIILPTTTVIGLADVDPNTSGTQLLGFFNSPYINDSNTTNDGSAITSADAGATVYVRVKVSDPFGDYDINNLKLTIDGPGTSADKTLTLVNTSVVDTNDNGAFKIYEYAWQTVINTGQYTVTARANEGTEGTIFKETNSTFFVTALDLGTPSITQFITALGGSDAGTTYTAGTNGFLRVTDLDKNTNSSAVETVTATVNGTSVTLTETGNDTGIFEVALPAAFQNLAAGTVLTASYTDRTDSHDTSSDVIRVPGPGGNLPPLVDLDTTNSSTVNYSGTYTQGGSAVAFYNGTAATSISDDGTTFNNVKVSISSNQIADGSSEQLVISGSTIALNFSNGTSISNLTVGGVTYQVAASVASGTSTLTFSKSGGGTVSLTQAQSLVEALQYQNSSANPTTSASRVFKVTVDDSGPLTSNEATFTVGLRALGVSVNDINVNEGSPYGVFTVTGVAGQQVSLALTSGTAINNTANSSATDGSVDFGPTLQYYDPTASGGAGAWVNYTSGYVAIPSSGTTLLVRTAIINDSAYEGSETYTLTATTTSGSSSIGRATIYDNGTGDIYKPDGSTDPTATKDDDEPLSVNDISVNEASPYGVFTVTGAAGQQLSLSLVNVTATNNTRSSSVTDGSVDYGPTLQYYDATAAGGAGAWTNYTSGYITIPSTGTTLLVRTTIINDTLYEGAETFKLVATNTGGQSNVITTGNAGTATIRDDGTGNIYPDNKTGATDGSATKDDDRALSVNDISVNEGSPYGVFTVTGAAGQQVSLALLNGTATNNTGNSTVTDGSVDFGPTLQYYDPTASGGAGAWMNYSSGFVTIPSGGTTLLVRTVIVNDKVYEGAETFSLVVSNTGATSYRGTATIRDDGTGNIYPDNKTGGTDGSATKDDDRLRVSDISVNEASPYAVFTVTGSEGQPVRLALVSGTATNNTGNSTALDGSVDFGPTLQYYDPTANGNAGAWVNYTGGLVAIPLGSTTLLVRTTVINDPVYEGAQTFRLVVSDAGGSSYSGTATLLDDGTGNIYPDNKTGATDANAVKDDDRPKVVPLVPVIVPPPAGPSAPIFLSAPAEQPFVSTEVISRPIEQSIEMPSVTLANPIPDQFVEQSGDAKFSVPDGTFVHSNPGETLSFAAVQSDGTPLPPWLSFDGTTATFEGKPPEGFTGDVQIRIIARDSSGNQSESMFRVNIGDAASRPAAAQPQSQSQQQPAQADALPQSVQPLSLDSDAGTRPLAPLADTPSIAVASPMPDQFVEPNGDAKFAVPDGTFVHTNPGEPLTLSATQVDGAPLPPWLSFNGVSATFEGKPPAGFAGELQVKVVGRDSSGNEAASLFRFSVGEQGQAGGAQPQQQSQTPPQPQSPQPPTALSAVGARPPTTPAEIPALTTATQIPDQFAQPNGDIRFAVPRGTFISANPADALTLSASMPDGQPLPQWLFFNAVTGVFDGKPPAGFTGELQIKVIARDAGGNEAESIFRFSVGDQGNATERQPERQPQGTRPADAPEGQSSIDVDAATVKLSRADAKTLHGRASLQLQLRDHSLRTRMPLAKVAAAPAQRARAG